MCDKRQMGRRGSADGKRRKDSEKSKKRKMGQECGFFLAREFGGNREAERRGTGEP